MGTFKKEISQHTQEQFMGKIYIQWSEIIIHPSVGKAKYPSHFFHVKRATLAKEKALTSSQLKSL